MILSQKVRFWHPFGIQLGPKWRSILPKWRQKNTLLSKMVVPFCVPSTDCLPTLYSERSWAPLWSIWGCFFQSFLGFLWILKTFRHRLLCYFDTAQVPPRSYNFRCFFTLAFLFHSVWDFFLPYLLLSFLSRLALFPFHGLQIISWFFIRFLNLSMVNGF